MINEEVWVINDKMICQHDAATCSQSPSPPSAPSSHQFITYITIHSHSITAHYGRLLCSLQLGTACHQVPAPWYSGCYWVRGPSRKVDAKTDFQTMSTRLAITLPRTSHMLRPPRFAVCLCIETNHQAALLWHRVAHFEVRHHVVALFLMIRYGVQSLPSSTVVRP
jgi:hypothetical protein